MKGELKIALKKHLKNESLLRLEPFTNSTLNTKFVFNISFKAPFRKYGTLRCKKQGALINDYGLKV